MASKTEPAVLSDGIKWEQPNHYSREKVTVLKTKSVAMLEVVGLITKDTPATGTADEDNTGDGLCATVAAGASAKLGTYTLTCVAAEANAGTFEVVDPEGNSLPDATVAVAYVNEQIGFTISDGAADFVVGDIFTITVAAGSGKAVPLDLTAVDGSAVAAGIMVGAVDATAADVDGAMIDSDALVATDNLVWPDDITDDQLAAAIAELEAVGIKAVSLA